MTVLKLCIYQLLCLSPLYLILMNELITDSRIEHWFCPCYDSLRIFFSFLKMRFIPSTRNWVIHSSNRNSDFESETTASWMTFEKSDTYSLYAKSANVDITSHNLGICKVKLPCQLLYSIIINRKLHVYWLADRYTILYILNLSTSKGIMGQMKYRLFMTYEIFCTSVNARTSFKNSSLSTFSNAIPRVEIISCSNFFSVHNLLV